MSDLTEAHGDVMMNKGNGNRRIAIIMTKNNNSSIVRHINIIKGNSRNEDEQMPPLLTLLRDVKISMSGLCVLPMQYAVREILGCC